MPLYNPPTSATANYAQAYTTNTSNWQTNSTSFIDPTNTGTASLTVIYSSGITLTIGGSTDTGITFTPANSSAVYLITCTTTVTSPGGSDTAQVQLTDGTTVLSQSVILGAASVISPVTLTSVYAPATASPVTVKLQLNTQSIASSVFIGQTYDTTQLINWTVTRIA